MEQKKTIFDYASQVLMTYGFTMLIMNLFCMLVGDAAQEISTLFALGDKGLSTGTAFEFLLISALLVCFRILFFTDLVIRRMRIAMRTVCMLLSGIAVTVLFIVVFDWFPVDKWEAWAMTLLCFAVSSAFSLGVTISREHLENRKMEEALNKIKHQQEG